MPLRMQESSHMKIKMLPPFGKEGHQPIKMQDSSHMKIKMLPPFGEEGHQPIRLQDSNHMTTKNKKMTQYFIMRHNANKHYLLRTSLYGSV